MRHEGLDPKGKVELARMLLQIGFKAEAVEEYLMAAKMYEEASEPEQAVTLYEKVLSIDEGNAEARQALYRLEPRSQTQIDEIIAKMGFGQPPRESTEPAVQTPTQRAEAQEPEAQSLKAPPKSVVEEFKPPEVSVSPEVTVTTPEIVPPPPEVKEARDLSKTEIDEFLASLTMTFEDSSEDLGLRKQLAEFFRDEALWSDAFFEMRSAYLSQPSVDKLQELLSILSPIDDKGTMLSFLFTESHLERPVDVQKKLLEKLIEACEKEGLTEKAAEAKEKLSKLSVTPAKSNVKIIEDIPRLAEKDTFSKDKKQSGPIQFI